MPCRDGGIAIAVQSDVSVKADLHRLFEETRSAFGTLDILVNNVGVTILVSKNIQLFICY